MKTISSFLLAGFMILFFAFSSIAQPTGPVAISANSGSLSGLPDRYGRPTPDSRGWTDPALNHNKLLQQQAGDGQYKLIGPYKVVGSSYLFGEHHLGDMVATEAKALNIYLSYNTYNQELEFYSTANPDKPLVKEPGTVDSFTIQANKEAGIAMPLKFVYGPLLGSKDKFYFQEVCKGERFSLYKRYTSDLGYSSANLAQSELRQFDLICDYYYTDSESKIPKKIKPNAAGVIKEFKSTMDLSAAINADEFTANPEASFCKAFGLLNQQKKGF